MFTKYMHLERLGTEEVDGIEFGTTYVFPKLDGTNAQLWMSDNLKICAGSRNRELTLSSDNAGFYNWAITQKVFVDFFNKYSFLHLYGEWLVPHSLQTYRDDAWRRFYVFDVWDSVNKRYLPYDEYKPLLDEFEITHLPPLAIIKNGTLDQYTKMLDKNVFLIQDGKGVGEGIVIKNYDWKNKYGNVVWAKLITNAFKEKHYAAMGAPVIGSDIVEEKIVDKYVTVHLVEKVKAKIELQHDGWHSKCIPQLLQTVFYDLVKEEMWDIIKHFKNPKIDFNLLNRFTIARIKTLMKDVF
jgi:hypothetical protein